MAPITVAVESLTTPADAITADSGSRSQKRLRRRLRACGVPELCRFPDLQR